MKNSKVYSIILLLSGLFLTGIGGAVLLMPVGFFATNGIILEDNINLLSEIRSPGGALLVSGLFIMAGAFVAKLAFTSSVISILMYLSYGISRLLSMAIDGLPSEGLVIATFLEILIGLTGVYALLKYRKHV